MQSTGIKKKIMIASISLGAALVIFAASVFALVFHFRHDIVRLLVNIKNDILEMVAPEPDVEPVTQYDADGEVIEIPSWITVDLLPINEYSRPGDKTEDIVGIVIHYVGNPGSTAQDNRNYFANLADTHSRYASSNFIIGLDGEIIQCVPLGEIAYCSNDRNIDTISIECCHPDNTGEFTDETYASLVRLCAWLSELYDVPPEGLLRHYDVSSWDKPCPLYFVEHEDEWERLKADIVTSTPQKSSDEVTK